MHVGPGTEFGTLQQVVPHHGGAGAGSQQLGELRRACSGLDRCVHQRNQ